MLNSHNKSRREFFKTCLRFGVGGGLIFGGIALGLREKSNDGQSNLCQFSSPCQGCGQFNGCTLPKRRVVDKVRDKEGGNHVR
jgi:hypothetical protein